MAGNNEIYTGIQNYYATVTAATATEIEGGGDAKGKHFFSKAQKQIKVRTRNKRKTVE